MDRIAIDALFVLTFNVQIRNALSINSRQTAATAIQSHSFANLEFG